MLKIRATKTSLFILAARYTRMPKACDALFSKQRCARVYFLRWANGLCEARLTSFDEKAILRVKTPCGTITYYPPIADLQERGMIEEK